MDASQVPGPPDVPSPPRTPSGAGLGDLLVRVVGGAVALVGGVLSAVLSLILVPLRLETPFGLVRVPLAVVFVVAANLALLWFAYRATGVRWAALLPAAGWFLIALVAIGPARDGAMLLAPGDWVGTLTIFAGAAALAVGVVRALVRNPPA